MADQAGHHHSEATDLTQPLSGVNPQWASPASAEFTTTPHREGVPNSLGQNIPIISSQAQQKPANQLSGTTNPQDLSVPAIRPGEPGKSDEVAMTTNMIAPSQLSEYDLPGMIFGSDFQWDFNPTSEIAGNIWSQMPADSWLDTVEGWEAMLRHDSPDPTEGDLSVDSRAIQFIPRSASVVSNDTNEYVEHNGRKYHKYHQGAYLLPNDEKEQDRLDLQHTIVTMVLHGELKLAPIKSPKRVLDIATGTGIWAIQFGTSTRVTLAIVAGSGSLTAGTAQKHPDATVIGTDLSPIQPDAQPENCRFWVEDAEDPWHFETPFDYIHARAVSTCFDNTRRVLQQAFDNLEPGGWIEFQDANLSFQSDDGTLNGTALDRVFQLFADGALRTGRDIRVSERYKQWITDIGFEEVRERKFKIPGNTWPKDPYAKQIGLYAAANVRDVVDAVSKVALQRGLIKTEEERAALAERARFDATDPDIHYYTKLCVVYGRKPYDSSLMPDMATTLAGIGTFY